MPFLTSLTRCLRDPEPISSSGHPFPLTLPSPQRRECLARRWECPSATMGRSAADTSPSPLGRGRLEEDGFVGQGIGSIRHRRLDVSVLQPWISGHYRSSGTYVAPYYRSDSGSTEHSCGSSSGYVYRNPYAAYPSVHVNG